MLSLGQQQRRSGCLEFYDRCFVAICGRLIRGRRIGRLTPRQSVYSGVSNGVCGVGASEQALNLKAEIIGRRSCVTERTHFDLPGRRRSLLPEDRQDVVCVGLDFERQSLDSSSLDRAVGARNDLAFARNLESGVDASLPGEHHDLCVARHQQLPLDAIATVDFERRLEGRR